MPSRIPGRRRAAGLAGFAGLVLTVGLALTGCDPSAADGKASSAPAATAATAAASTGANAPSATAPTVAAQPSAPPSAHPQTSGAKPQPKVTTAQPPAEPEPQHTQAAAGGSGCEIRSSAGNCYAAGQFCRNDDLGRSTHDANGRVIYCRMVSGKPHWQA
ncbi:hypothetical protein [Kitasatospora cathayae]|uniref:Lipoprotein n=1 Tax=Kitasatospora cathayae TaxID=3004092 RepID=A0ABY7QDZ2_9ACTN|nr:hypothetical protein [Kitasatospora sp. HUAS 3-15]WBP90931.1 hypothetical protein O1G21_37065 [Kitasatospora sp. HUAS 3-15]